MKNITVSVDDETCHRARVHAAAHRTSVSATRATRRFSYWGCAILAAAQALGCSEVLSEDMQHGQIVDGMRIVEPFR